MQGRWESMAGYHRRGVQSAKQVEGGGRYASPRSLASLPSVVWQNSPEVAEAAWALEHLRVFAHPPSHRDPSRGWDRRD